MLRKHSGRQPLGGSRCPDCDETSFELGHYELWQAEQAVGLRDFDGAVATCPFVYILKNMEVQRAEAVRGQSNTRKPLSQALCRHEAFEPRKLGPVPNVLFVAKNASAWINVGIGHQDGAGVLCVRFARQNSTSRRRHSSWGSRSSSKHLNRASSSSVR